MNDNTFTYADLLRDLLALTPEGLAQPVEFWGEGASGHIGGVQVLEQDYQYDGYEGYWPKSDLGNDEESDEPIMPAGTVRLTLFEPTAEPA